ncbi:unnamed protein product [Arabidopsis halleri]
MNIVEYMLDVDSHMWSMRRSKANFFLVSSLLCQFNVSRKTKNSPLISSLSKNLFFFTTNQIASSVFIQILSVFLFHVIEFFF